jgi:hypothetical protein
MSTLALENIARQVERLAPEDKLTLVALLIESLRRQMEPVRRPLSAYYGLGADSGFKTAKEVDAFIQQERALWER